MPNIVDRFGQLVDDAIPKPELARQLLLLGYRAKDVQLLLAPEKELTPARQYAAQIAMDAMIAPLAHPQRAALVNIFMPCELLHAFHLLPMFAEATACYLNGAAAERGFIHYAESAGISPTLCSYHKALLGMGLSGTAGKPLFTACTSIACDANNLTFRRLAQHYGIPHFYLDVPYDHDEYAVAEVSDRLREFAAFLEDATHQKLDEAALQQAVAHSGRTLELLQQAQAAKAGRNLHNDVTSEFYEVFVTHTMLGTPQAEQYARKLLADIEAGQAYYDLVEVMTCKGGCVGGAGQPYGLKKRKEKRGDGLHLSDNAAMFKRAERNPVVAQMMAEYGEERCHELLHVTYTNK